MKCEEDSCSQEARFFINASKTPLCQHCMIESLCSVPTQVISIEAYDALILKGVAVQDGKIQDFKRAG